MNSFVTPHARQVLLGAQAANRIIPVCDHYSGVPARMQKSLQLQQELAAEHNGMCVFDVTLDCEDGAPVGGEIEHAHLVTELVNGAAPGMRVAARLHSVRDPIFEQELRIIAAGAAQRLSHLMIPKVESVADIEYAAALAAACGAGHVPLHALIESPLAVRNAFDIASHARVESLSFGLMDFVSAHGGAISDDAMRAHGQFTHPVVVRAKLEIAAACHAHGKTPSHCVVTEFADAQRIEEAAHHACRDLSFTRMWSIHPSQIRPILKAFAINNREIDSAIAILEAANAASWAPISYKGVLHDRASYRYYWQLLERAYCTGQALPQTVQGWVAVAA